jgi:hypothetical protein
MLNLLISLLKTELLKRIIIKAAEAIAKRTDNTVDDEAVRIIKEALKETGNL